MFSKILVANRGEIAVRIIRACRDMGIIAVAIYSEADKYALHTQIADEAICIGPASSVDSYLNIPNIISAAICSGAEAIHPGFGFLSENPEFAKACEENDIKFIGPSSSVIRTMGDKVNAKKMATECNVPQAKSSEGDVKTIEDARKICEEITYPVMLKAASGGGGKGIRIVNDESELESSFTLSKNEAFANFKDDRVYIEKYIDNPKHIEVQILGDSHGNVIHLFDRECSIQRRNQKIIEEAPSPSLNDEKRREVCESAVNLAKHIGYEGAGTVEYLYDNKGNFYFCEMNTRIQVEHPVTEFITGVDIVCEQIRIAFGKEIQYKQEDLKILGHSIECRINAEDPNNNFAPSPGTVELLNVPGSIGIRVDTSIYQGYTVPPYYDSMLAKLISFGNTRERATTVLTRGLSEFLIAGLTTNIDLNLKIINSKIFKDGTFTTKSLENGDFN